MVWPRSAKNWRNRRRISLLCIDVFYFLSNGVLLISKTLEGSEKTSGIAQLEGGTQFQTFHFSRQSVTKRGPPGQRDRFVRHTRGNAVSQQLFADNRLPTMFPPRHIRFGKPPVVEEVLVEQLLDHGFRGGAEFRLEFATEARDRVIAAFQ